MSYISKFIKWLPFFLLYVPFKFFSLLPIKKNILLFGTGTGLYHDNSKYVFEFFLNNKELYPDCKAYWVAQNHKTYDKLNFENKPVIYKNTIKAAYCASMARAYFVTAEIFDVFWYIGDKTKLVQLWHGTPIKYIGYDYKDDIINLKKKKKYFSKNYLFSRFDYFIIEDEQFKKIFESAFRIKKDKIKAFGQPRNEIFFTDYQRKRAMLTELDLNKFKKIILYAPTFRKRLEDNRLLLEKILTTEIVSFLNDNNYCLLLKLHPFVPRLDVVKELNSNNILDVSHYEDIQELLLISDAAVTDISSWGLDYLLFKNNLYSFFPDENQYKKDRNSFYKKSHDIFVRNTRCITDISEILFEIDNISSPCARLNCNSSLNVLRLIFD